MKEMLKKDDDSKENTKEESDIKKYSKLALKCFGYFALFAAYGAATLMREEMQDQDRNMKYANPTETIDVHAKYK